MRDYSKNVYEFGLFRLIESEHKVLRNGEPVPLAAKAFDLLLTLVQNNGRTLSKDELLRVVWSDVHVEENNLSVNISALRKVLREGGNDGRQYIETVPKYGYRFQAIVKTAKGNRERAIKSIAVLPLVNAGGTAKSEYLSDGITETLIHNLSQLPRLRVVAHSTVFRYKGEDTNPLEIGRALQVATVLSGRVIQINHRLVVRVELVDVAEGWQLWGEQYIQPTSNILAVQRDISRVVTEQLQIKLSGKQKRLLSEQQTGNNAAYRSYLKGRYFLGKRTVEGISTGLEYFQRAVEIDSNYALAYVGIADCYSLLTSYGASSPRDTFPKMKEAARRASKINGNLAEAHASMGHVKMYEWDWAGAEKSFKRAIKINAAYPAAHHWYATYLKAMGRFEEGFREIRHAYKLDPLSLVINSAIASMHYCARQYDQAVEQALKTLKMDENLFIAYAVLGLSYSQKGKYQEAIAALQKSINLSSNPEALALLGHTYATAGKRADARRVLDELEELSKQRYVESACVAIVYAGMGDKNRAFRWLGKAFDERNELLVSLAVDPIFENLRLDSRFMNLLLRIGLQTNALIAGCVAKTDVGRVKT